ncbi:hypothetical protein C4D60_Mb01t33200 [Musa balbisiana]|uniref:Uncharacterized protein n=1 Tax=Musa balbisiana TaxID=52838 RepID=A0A4S8JSH0_MUSBA|nr:hypothetical protein C4D60_Mb01t33200 [Musa balbisiana]
MAVAEGRRRRCERDGRAVAAATQREVVDSGREAVTGLWWEVIALLLWINVAEVRQGRGNDKRLPAQAGEHSETG